MFIKHSHPSGWSVQINVDQIAYVTWLEPGDGTKGRIAVVNFVGMPEPLKLENLTDKAADEIERALRNQRGDQS
jgi:hypothetical protein